ncbi:MAG TPA: hypothetical protein DCP02_04925, partial [Actinobacteria bacterium]|nr:hypothetical protein [Actinomycetota bacterium]
MFENIGSKAYSNPHAIYLEKMEKNLRHFLEDKAVRVSRAGQDILIELDQKSSGAVLAEIKNNPELTVESLKNINIIGDRKKVYLLSELSAADSDYSIILKIGLKEGKTQAGLERIIDQFKDHYRNAEFYGPGRIGGEEIYNYTLPGQIMHGSRGFDIDLSLEDDIVRAAHIDSSISRVLSRDFYRGLEIEQLVSYMGRFDYNAGIFSELAFCLGIEELLQLQVPRRAKYIRMLLSELFRITSHLNFLAELVEILGHDMAWNMIMLEREKLLGIIEVITGARVIPNYVRIGGVNSRIGSDIIKKIRREIAAFLKKFRKIEKVIIADFAIMERLRGLGVISKDAARGSGISGPNMRASAIRYDLRKNLDYTEYRDIHFTVPYAKNGDCLDRMMVRFGEIHQSIKIIGQIVEQMPSGPVMKKINLSHLDFSLTPFTVSVECPHG